MNQNIFMKKKSLIETNPYLKDLEMRKKLVKRSVQTSCAVEGIAAKTRRYRNNQSYKAYAKTHLQKQENIILESV